MNRIHLKNYIGIGILLVLVIFIGVSIKRCSTIVYQPKESGEKANLYNSNEISEEAKLLTSGASSSDNTSVTQFSFMPFLTLSGGKIDNFYRQDDIFFTEKVISESTSFGITTYGGNVYRSAFAFGDGNISDGNFGETWKSKLNASISTEKNFKCISQPLVITWEPNLRQMLKMSDQKKTKDGLTEVIFASADGYIYFLDIDDGSPTRNPISLGVPVSGTGSIVLQGVPLLIIGGGGNSAKDTSNYYIVNLINGEILEKFGSRSNFASEYPEEKYDFSASPLISSDDTVFLTQGENGVIYSAQITEQGESSEAKVNLSEEIAYTYSCKNKSGAPIIPDMAGSAAGASKYAFMADREGKLLAIDVNDWSTVWMRELGQCVVATPVVELDEATGNAYVYIGTAVKSGEDAISLYKLNAANGDIIWRHDYKGISATKYTEGGVISAATLGTDSLDGNVYFEIAGAGSKKKGELVCLDKKTGTENYSVAFKYFSYGSPVVSKTSSGEGILYIADYDGNLFCLNGANGELLFDRKVGEEITSQPVLYEDTLLVASDEKIYGINIQ